MEKFTKYLTDKLHLTWRHYWYFAFVIYLIQFYNLLIPDLNRFFLLYTFYTIVGFFSFYVFLRLIYLISTDIIGRRIFFELVILLGIFGFSGYIIGFNNYGERLKIFSLVGSPVALYIAAPLWLILTFAIFDLRQKLSHLKHRIWLHILIVLCEFIFCFSAGYAVHVYSNPPQVTTTAPPHGFL